MKQLTFLAVVSVVLGQTILVDGTSNEGSFEGAGTLCADGTYQGWTIVNGTQTNRWAVNDGAGSHHGSQAIYITNNCAGSPPPHQYSTGNSSVVHFYRDVTLPAGEPYLTISAYIKVQGEVGLNYYDYLDIFVAPTSVTPTAGTQVSATYRIARYSLISTSWTQVSASYCGTAGQTYRVIFSWRNDGSAGTQPPAAVDQIHIVASTLPGIINVPTLPYTHGLDNTCGKGNKFTSANTPVCGDPSYYGGEDMIWTFTPTTSGVVTVSLTSPTSNTGLMVYQGGTIGSCGGLTGATCVAQAQSSSGDKTLSFCVTAGLTYYVQLDYSGSSTCGPFSNLTISAPVPGIINVPSLPYAHGPDNTCGKVDKFTSTNTPVCGSWSYYAGEDMMWVFTPTTSGVVTVSLTSPTSNTGLMVYEGGMIGSCGGLTGATCVARAQSSSGDKTLRFCVTAGQTYYVQLDYSGSSTCGSFSNLTISAPAVSPPGIINVPTLPYTHGADNTCGKGDKFTSSNAPVCGSSNYYGGEDMMWVFTPTTSGVVTVNLTSSTTWTGLMVYRGGTIGPCGGLTGATCVAYAQGPLGDKTLSFCVTAGLTYRVLLDLYPPPTCGSFSNLTISAPNPVFINVPSLPYAYGPGSTCGEGDEFGLANIPGGCPSSGGTYDDGEDMLWVYSPSQTQPVKVTLQVPSGSGSGASLRIYRGGILGSCGGLTGSTCVAADQSDSATKTLTLTLQAGQTYYFLVDTDPCQIFTEFSITPTGNTALGAAGGLGPVQVSPNPTTGQVELSYVVSSAEPLSLTLYNALGAVVYTKELQVAPGSGMHTFSVANLPAGIYLLIVRQGAFLEQVRLVKE